MTTESGLQFRLDPPPSPEEAAAVIAAVESFIAQTTPALAPRQGMSPWQRAALIEGVSAKRLAFPVHPASGFPLGGN